MKREYKERIQRRDTLWEMTKGIAILAMHLVACYMWIRFLITPMLRFLGWVTNLIKEVSTL